MYISKKDWLNFINSLSKIDQTASDTVVRYVQKNGFSDTDSLVRFSYDVVNTLGNASAALVAKMYDEVSALEGKFFDPAELADTPDYGEVAKTIHGALKTSKNPDEVGGAVSRLVKRTGQDTFIKNGMRDHAEFAWIPHGDTCSFCLMIAANGWQPMSKNALRNGHAEHIHKNCDCSFMIRHEPDLDVAGYKPEKYKEMFDEAEGETWEEKVNSLRRMQYAERKDVINAQKRAAYARKKRSNQLIKEDGRSIMNVSTGTRNQKPLSEKEIKECILYATELGMPEEYIKYSDNYYTSYSPMFDILLIGTDVLPKDGATTINGQLTMKCAIAHEIVGHREVSLNGVSNFAKDDPRDEAQASIRAARFAPGLSMKERNMLIKDAITRLRNGGYKVREVKDSLDIYKR